MSELIYFPVMFFFSFGSNSTLFWSILLCCLTVTEHNYVDTEEIDRVLFKKKKGKHEQTSLKMDNISREGDAEVGRQQELRPQARVVLCIMYNYASHQRHTQAVKMFFP